MLLFYTILLSVVFSVDANRLLEETGILVVSQVFKNLFKLIYLKYGSCNMVYVSKEFHALNIIFKLKR